MIMVSKKSQAHVEIILATTLFIGFLIFAFVFLNSSIKTTKDIPTDKIERAIFSSPNLPKIDRVWCH